jgi:hypothetical protein
MASHNSFPPGPCVTGFGNRSFQMLLSESSHKYAILDLGWALHPLAGGLQKEGEWAI